MSLDINLTNVQSKPIVVSSNTTAENDKVYHVVANATFTDPTPVEGKGFTVFVRNGTATVGGANFTHSGTIVKRTFHSGSWFTVLYSTSQFLNAPDENVSNKSTNVNTDQASNTKYPSVKAVFDWATNLFFPKPTGTTSEYLRGDGSVATFPTIPSIAGLVPETRTINGLDLSANRTLTTAEINDSADKRYVTDAQLTVIGNTSGTNTGDETQSSILTKLGWFYYNKSTDSTPITGTTVNTIIENVLIPANTLPTQCKLQIEQAQFNKTNQNGTLTARIYLSTVSNDISSATLIGTFSGIASNLWLTIDRIIYIDNNTIKYFSPTTSSNNGQGTVGAGRSTSSINRAVDNYIILAVQLGNASDIVLLSGVTIKTF